MRTWLIFIGMCLASDGFALGQGAEASKDGKKPKRHVRMLVMGDRPAPAYEKQGDLYVEVDPDAKLIPPMLLEVDGMGESGVDPVGKKAAGVVGFSLNQIFRIEGYRGESVMAFTLKHPHVKQVQPVKLQADLGKLLHPLVIVSADPGSEAWARPKVVVLDLSIESLQGGEGLVVNQSKWPLRIDYGGSVKEVKSGISKVSATGKLNGAVPVSVELKTRDQAVMLFSNRYMLAPDERLLLFMEDMRTPVANLPPVVVRFSTDAIQVSEK